MKTETQVISISSVNELEQLLQEKKLYHTPKDIQLKLGLPWKNADHKEDYENKLSAHISECGCAHGSFLARLFTLIAVLAIGVYITFFTELPIAIQLVSIVLLPGLFIVGAFIPPLVSLVSLAVILFLYQSLITLSPLILLSAVLGAYVIGALLGKTIGSLIARKSYRQLLEKIKNTELADV